PRMWTAPSVASSGHIKVRYGALTDAAEVIQKHVSELEDSLQHVKSRSGSFNSLMGWATGQAFGGDPGSAVSAFSAAGPQTSEGHHTVVRNLRGSADTYSETEAKTAQHVTGKLTPGASSSAAPVSRTSGNWSE